MTAPVPLFAPVVPLGDFPLQLGPQRAAFAQRERTARLALPVASRVQLAKYRIFLGPARAVHAVQGNMQERQD